MRWFKHYSDNYRGRSVASFHREFGHTGVSWYFLFTEICCEKLQKNNDKNLADNDFTFSFDVAFVESSLRGTFAKITRWLRHGVAMGLWSFTTTEFELHVKYPILLELLHSDLVKTRTRRDSVGTVSGLDIDKEEEEDIEIYKEEHYGGAALIFEIWNDLRGALPEARELTKKRRVAGTQRWKEKPDSDFWCDVVQKIAALPFYCGQNDRQWVATIDYILRPGKAIEIMERPVFEAPKKVQTMGVIGS